MRRDVTLSRDELQLISYLGNTPRGIEDSALFDREARGGH